MDPADEIQRIERFLEAKYLLENHRLSTGRLNLSITSVGNLDALLAAIRPEDFEQDERLPYWAEIWPSSLVLAGKLSEMDLSGKSILELGSGLGIAGVAAACSGGKLCFSDYEPDALRFCRLNALQNGISDFETTLLDWRNPSLNAPFDLILGADILYEEVQIEWVLKLIQKLLAPGGTAWIAEPGRKVAGELPTWMELFGFQVNSDSYPILHKEISFQIRIFEIRKG